MESDQGKLFIDGISWEEKLKDYYGEVVMREKFTVSTAEGFRLGGVIRSLGA